MPILKTDAVILDRNDFRETSHLVTMFTSEFGKITAQAKGARRKTGKFGTNFQIATLNRIVFYERQSNGLHIISQADLLNDFDGISRSVNKLACASYLLELVNSAMPVQEENKGIFELITNFLIFLNKEDKIRHIIQFFEIKFLNLSGFKPRLDRCVNCAGRITDLSRFSYVLGGLLCRNCFDHDKTAHDLLNGTIATITHIEKTEIKKIVNFRMMESVEKELQRILRNFIDFHIGHRFKSLDFLKKLRYAYA